MPSLNRKDTTTHKDLQLQLFDPAMRYPDSAAEFLRPTATLNSIPTDRDSITSEVRKDGLFSSPDPPRRSNVSLELNIKKCSAKSSFSTLDATRCNHELAFSNHSHQKSSWSAVDSRITVVDDAGSGIIAEKIEEKPTIPIPEFSKKNGDSENSSRLKNCRERWLDFRTWFTPYRQLFLLVAGLNGALVVAIALGALGGASRDFSVMVIINVLIAIAIRNEWIIRLVYWIAIKCFRSTRISVRIRKTIVGVLYHIGGLHSGCGVSALFWLALAVYRHFSRFENYHPAVLTMLSISISCILITCTTAMPFVRGPKHDLFEILHRFVGWLGIICTLLFVVLGHALGREQGSAITWKSVVGDAEFWMMVVIFILIVSSWITTRRVPVQVFSASKKATVIKFPGGLTSGVHTRISRGGLKEWHIFGSISEGKHADCHYLVAAVQGEFTRRLNLDQPSRIYTKIWKPAGLPYFSRMFHRGVAVCSGTGIGAVASTCIQHADWFLIWIGPELEVTYGREILDLLERTIPSERRLIWDTRGPMGRPDVFSLLSRTYRDWGAEVVLFIGSPALNHTVLRSSREAGIPLFGSIWDA